MTACVVTCILAVCSFAAPQGAASCYVPGGAYPPESQLRQCRVWPNKLDPKSEQWYANNYSKTGTGWKCQMKIGAQPWRVCLSPITVNERQNVIVRYFRWAPGGKRYPPADYREPGTNWPRGWKKVENVARQCD